ncbi:MAG: hypothetical protein ACREOZ_03775, partial [Gloeomargaritales cyanobacterium]
MAPNQTYPPTQLVITMDRLLHPHSSLRFPSSRPKMDSSERVTLKIAGTREHTFRTIVAPLMNSPAYRKGIAYDELAATLAGYKDEVAYVDLVSVFANHIPVCCANAEHFTKNIGERVTHFSPLIIW